ncbi:unnamed protein product, partial [Mesorhabditis belari]|uniref:Seminal fluid protein HACP044 n=1 Tax=Mesorhabditis belari TaxID=2138241 RepID=A0AAF3FJW3_9BILA
MNLRILLLSFFGILYDFIEAQYRLRPLNVDNLRSPDSQSWRDFPGRATPYNMIPAYHKRLNSEQINDLFRKTWLG